MAVRNFRELREKMAPERRARNEAQTERMLQEMPLDELRAARELTQEHLAQIFKVSQGSPVDSAGCIFWIVERC